MEKISYLQALKTRRAKFCIIPITLLLSLMAKGQTLVNELDEKFKIERSISERLEQTLKTRLDKNFFDITVEVKLKRASVGLSVHRIEEMRKSDNIKNSYVAEMNEAVKQNSRPFEVESLQITLGLSDKVDQKYRESLRVWITEWSSSMFGSIAEANVIIRPSNVTSNLPPSSQENFLEALFSFVTRFQNFLGMVFLGLVVLFLRYFPTNKKNIVNTIEPVAKAVAFSSGEGGASEPLLISYDDSGKKNTLLSLKKKIAWLSNGMVSHTQNLLSMWMERDVESNLKIAAWLEAMAEGSLGASEGSRGKVPTLSPAVHAKLPKNLAILSEMDIDSQLKLFHQIYSDILAGEFQEKEPKFQDFEFLQKWSESDLTQVFYKLDRSSQVTFLSRLPKVLLKNFSTLIDQNLFRDVLRNSLHQEPASDEQLLKELFAWSDVHHPKPLKTSPDFLFNIVKLRDAWSVLPPLEEAIWLHQAVLNYPELKEKLNNCKDNIAFLGDLPQDQLRKICLMTKTRELAAVVKLLPFLRSTILGVCGEMMKRDVISEELLLVEPTLTQNFNKFVEAYKRAINESEFSAHEALDEKEKFVA